jgi:hypothetical protein
MYCPECTPDAGAEGAILQPMRCVFTKQISKWSRFRIYRCPKCRHYEETYETVTVMLPPTVDQAQKIRLGIDQAKMERFRFARLGKKRASTTASGELVGQ